MNHDNFELESLIESAMMKFDNFEIQRRPFNVRCKCHICGDSRRDATQSRLNAYYHRDDLMINCYNCGYSNGASHYLRLYHPYEWGIYLHKIRSERINKFVKSDNTEVKEVKTIEEYLNDINHTEVEKPKVEYPRELPLCYPINDIEESHQIIKYIKERMIPKDKWYRLFFTTEFRKLANIVVPNTFRFDDPEPRLVIPIYNKEGYIESFQGRALRSDARERYMTIKYSEEATKIYGLDTVNPNKTAYFLEGQIDSLFIDNGMAITGGNISLNELDEVYSGDRAFIMDNEDRHPDTIKRIQKLLFSGEKIVLFDKVNWEGKDINAFVQNGVSIEDINKYISKNTLSGLEAQLRFTHWNKVNPVMIKEERKGNYRQEKRKQNVSHFFDKIKGHH